MSKLKDQNYYGDVTNAELQSRLFRNSIIMNKITLFRYIIVLIIKCKTLSMVNLDQSMGLIVSVTDPMNNKMILICLNIFYRKDT